jgi:hypothetical protein
MLCSMTSEQRREYLPKYFKTLCTAASLNDASFSEANDWGACLILLPPGKKVDNVWTLLPSGGFSILWNLGVMGTKVG